MRQYRVLHQQIRWGEVTNHVYGPYRWFLWALLVAWWKCGEWDATTVQKRGGA